MIREVVKTEIENIKPIPHERVRDDYRHKLISRSEDLALYELTKENVILYETHKIRKRVTTLPNGEVLPFREILASESEFGQYGFSHMTLSGAVNKLSELSDIDFEIDLQESRDMASNLAILQKLGLTGHYEIYNQN